jgi:hypothetical protein
MGELSKKIGEHGEKVVMQFLETIGWQPLETGLSFDCFLPKEHGRSETRGTHGKDLGYVYKSPLVEGELVETFISVKYSDKPYPDNPRNKFKEHFSDLANGLECYVKSSERIQRINDFDSYSKINTVGILFWLNNSPQETDIKLLDELAKSRFHDEYIFQQIVVITNDSFDFVNKCVREIKTLTLSENIQFYYPTTGNNLNPTTRRISGNILPFEYLTSKILLFRVILDDNLSHLYICSKDNFNVSDFKRLVGLAIEISGGWAQKVFIGFPDFNELRDTNSINNALQTFEAKNYITKHINVFNIK